MESWTYINDKYGWVYTEPVWDKWLWSEKTSSWYWVDESNYIFSQSENKWLNPSEFNLQKVGDQPNYVPYILIGSAILGIFLISSKKKKK